MFNVLGSMVSLFFLFVAAYNSWKSRRVDFMFLLLGLGINPGLYIHYAGDKIQIVTLLGLVCMATGLYLMGKDLMARDKLSKHPHPPEEQ